jgi:hypothetical protein
MRKSRIGSSAPPKTGPKPRASGSGVKRVDFARVNRMALAALPALLRRWLPDGQTRGREYVALNPRRKDRHRGSFKINLATGRWADFATGDRGGDVVSFAAYLFDLTQTEAARSLASMIGVDHVR